jgi:hypothetical protein
MCFLRNGFVFIYPYLRTLIKECKGNRHELKVSLLSVLLMHQGWYSDMKLTSFPLTLRSRPNFPSQLFPTADRSPSPNQHLLPLAARNLPPGEIDRRWSLTDPIQSPALITKDADFVDTFLTIQQPYKLLLVSTGNIKNSELEAVFAKNLPQIVNLLDQHDYIEIDRDTIITH